MTTGWGVGNVGLIDKISGELIDIVEWTDDTRDTIVWRFPRHDNEIKMSAKLVVREGQVAVFVNEGTIADVFTPGTYTLETRNLPVLSTLKGWKYGFESPFKAEVYFVSTRQFTDQKWGTQNPAMMRDPEFGMVRVRAFGTYSFKAADPAVLLRELVGTDPEFTHRRGRRVHPAERRLPGRHRAGHLRRARCWTSRRTRTRSPTGSPSSSARTSSTSVSTCRASSSRTSRCRPRSSRPWTRAPQMGVLGDLDHYTKFQAASAITEAAGEPRRAGRRRCGRRCGREPRRAAGQALATGRHAAPRLPPRRRRCRGAPSGTSASTASRWARSPRPRSGPRHGRYGVDRHPGLAGRHERLDPARGRP